MRVRAVALRILQQLRRDRRTVALMMLAPLFILTLVYFILSADTTPQRVAVINAPQHFVENLERYDLRVVRLSEGEAHDALLRQEVIATVDIKGGRKYIEADGSDSAHINKVLPILQQAGINPAPGQRADMAPEIHYVYGSPDLSTFDNFGAALIGIIIFFFVFLVAGISFLEERISGTLERVLSTPIKRWEIVAGYVLGFGVVTVAQSALISFYCVYVLGVLMVGSFGLVLVMTLLAALSALALGILLSTTANSQFQFIQFIPLVIVPQIFFSGMFDLSPWLQPLSYALPVYYIAEGLTEVMLRGGGFMDILPAAAFLAGLTTLFMVMNTKALKKYRQI
ncbi:MAG: ABC transporter permease [Syntrophomonadaceae bacterium]|nr:ABC transporter permease [Syntrophomonadaceae bacterium]